MFSSSVGDLQSTGAILRFQHHATLAALLIACGGRSGETSLESEPESEAVCVEPTAEECALHRVPLRELLAQPDRWRGRRVAVEGYLHHEQEGTGLYPSAEDYRRRNPRIALDVTSVRRDALAPVCQCNDQDVVVVGIYDPSDKGAGGVWGGALKDIEQVQPRQE
jgi:hypothetical protein